MSDDTDRMHVEIRRLIAESDKFVAEQHKLIAERSKLDAEAAKFYRERWWQPALSLAAVIGGLLGTAAFIA
jgi:hypothetical protein